ncbi:hypothetical protein QM012_001662 [Aureobasidium pullulans]|uniref:HNH nuclease domain-containing protein n=1 Tax=Aureobasidium pullulans TaxID=5580 RepID=A0ABR0TER2_AURPU
MVRVLGYVDGRLTCIDSDLNPRQEWKRATTPFLTPAEHLAQIKQKDSRFACTKSTSTILRNSRKKEQGTAQLRGSKGYVEPRINYCSDASRFKSVRDGLIAYPSWERQDFSVLLKMWCVDSPEHRHSRAAYAFNLDGTPTTEYEKPLSIYAQQRMDVVAAHSCDYTLKTGRETGRPVSWLATRPVKGECVRKQCINSHISEHEEIEAEEEEHDEREETENEDEEDEDDDEGPWYKQLERRARSNVRWKRRRESRGRGPSPDPQRTEEEAKRKKHKGRGRGLIGKKKW